MPKSYSQVYRQKRKHLRNYVGRGHGPIREVDAEAIRELCDAFSEEKRDMLESLSETDLPCATEHLLEAAGDTGDGDE